MADSKFTVYGALGANLAIAVTKFIAAGLTGSSSMLSEGIHSMVDTGNSCLLLIGLSRSRRPPSVEHPYGHGKELYFWTLIVGVLVFGLGGGVSFYEGIVHLRNPPPLEDARWNYVVLACAAVFEGTSFSIGWRQFKAQRQDQPVLHALKTSKDPATLTVLAEDSAALVGLLFAACGVYFSHRFQRPELDALASMAIGLLLAGVAVWLIHESRDLLIGEGVSPATARAIREMALRDGFTRIGPILSMYMGPHEVLLTLELQADPGRDSGDVAAAVHQLEARVRERWPVIRRLYVEVTPSGAPPP